jgi:hypothetical protein
MSNARKALDIMSPDTRAFIEAVRKLDGLPLTSTEKLLMTAKLTQDLTEAQRGKIALEAQRTAIELQFADPRNGNRAQRRAARRESKR